MDEKTKKTLLTLAKQNRALRKKNKEQLLGKTRYEESLSEFHKPVTEKLEVPIEDVRQDLKAIEDAIHNITIPSTIDSSFPQLPDAESTLVESTPKKKYRYTAENLDEGLDVSYLEQNSFILPSQLVNKPNEIEEMLEKAERRTKSLGSFKAKVNRKLKKPIDDFQRKALEEELNLYQSDLDLFKLYREKLKVLKSASQSFKISGEGLVSELEKLTDKLLGGDKKVYNKIVEILDLLLNSGEITADTVKEYYSKFLSN
ncbi:uncharacterized protein [Centruroides vittatus]|uniref:uncharacterized protein n=1 Tax=Centruroides vittatus TaxID=120091 RepID=UPI00350F1B3E